MVQVKQIAEMGAYVKLVSSPCRPGSCHDAAVTV
jgi:translation initiation factor 2 alpha subunit (eIF-2alpha)